MERRYCIGFGVQQWRRHAMIPAARSIVVGRCRITVLGRLYAPPRWPSRRVQPRQSEPEVGSRSSSLDHSAKRVLAMREATLSALSTDSRTG
eukprot:7390103-Prymnesium_polylepis.1